MGQGWQVEDRNESWLEHLERICVLEFHKVPKDQNGAKSKTQNITARAAYL